MMPQKCRKINKSPVYKQITNRLQTVYKQITDRKMPYLCGFEPLLQTETKQITDRLLTDYKQIATITNKVKLS